MTTSTHQEFPFTAVAGQDNFKLALILAAINPLIGGVLVSGPRGSAKSTLARGFAAVLPDAKAPFVTLPLGASEERLLGTLDLNKVLNEKAVSFHPGLLSKAHGGVLYVDEVNLLTDNLVDQLLDVAASGINRVERDGISHEHAAQFILIGTMNPDEGELRPQLQDRFGLMVNLANNYSLEERMQIVKLREAFDQNAEQFHEEYRIKQKNLRQSIEIAQTKLTQVVCDDEMRLLIAQACQEANVDGVRADIVWLRAAMAYAAWRGGKKVTRTDLDMVGELVLSHRRQANDGSTSTQSQSMVPNTMSTPQRPNRPLESQRDSSSRPLDNREPTQGSGQAQNTQRSSSSSGESRQTEQDWGSMPAQVQHLDQETCLKKKT